MLRRSAPAVLLLALFLLTACGHTISYAPNYGGPFDFRRPPCTPAPRPAAPPAGEVDLRYLGAGGLYIEWKGQAVLLPPFFTTAAYHKVLFTKLSLKDERLRQGLGAMDLSRVSAIVVGHSHYDHLAEVPALARSFAPRSRIYVNQSGAHALKVLTDLDGRIEAIEAVSPRGIEVKDERGAARIRLRPVESRHAPHFYGILLSGGNIRNAWTGSWEDRRLLALKAGKTFAFVIDLLAEDGRRVLYRIYYQDAANPRGAGRPRLEAGDSRPFDLAVLCAASFQFVRDHPGDILKALRPRHVLVTHYEDFFRDSTRPMRFVLFLTDSEMDRFLHRVRLSLGTDLANPANPVCGPGGRGWTMPMPGNWIRFRVPTGSAAGGS